MSVLYWLESLRTPLGDAFFSIITHLGGEVLFIIAGLFFFWCVDKMEGYFLLSVGFCGTLINQFLKLCFRVPRPWVKDPNFSIVESARADATGYSFPSGHAQSSVGIFAGIARWHQNLWQRVVCIAICVLVPLSRMYLGVHTPADVGVSIVIALGLVFLVYPIIRKAQQNPRIMQLLMAAMTALALAYLLFIGFYPFADAVDPDNFAHGTKNAYTMLGCILGMWLSYEVERRYIRFDPKAVWWVQLLKLLLGLAIVVGIRAVLKAPLYALFNGHYAADGIRYFVMIVFVGCIWPLSFRHFEKLSKK